MKKAQKQKGQKAFDSYYSAIYGQRWQDLRSALQKQSPLVSFAPCKEKPPYYLGIASIQAAASLPLENAKRILDMCAAPGGKTLVLASRMAENAKLFCNDRSFERFMRLKKVSTDCLCPSVFQRLYFSCFDAGVLCHAPAKDFIDPFDAILLDAPCSSEHYVINDKNYLESWTQGRLKSIAITQWACLSCAYRLLRAGGFLLYCTCCVNPTENDDMAKRLLSKFPGVVFQDATIYYNDFAQKHNLIFPTPQKTTFGYFIAPDVCSGAGPLYFFLAQKPEK